ncbi:MAG: DoxX family protein [Nanoarchaeota archaeon]
MNKNYAALPLRLILGLVFTVHGYSKLFGGIPGTTEFFSGLGIPLAGFFAYAVSIVEFFGGIALILGFFVGIVSILLAIDMLVAALLVHLPKGFLVSNGGYEFTLTLIAGLVTLAMLGSGKLSLQKVFKR